MAHMSYDEAMQQIAVHFATARDAVKEAQNAAELTRDTVFEGEDPDDVERDMNAIIKAAEEEHANLADLYERVADPDEFDDEDEVEA